MRKITLSLATALILLCSFTANAVLNMGGKTIFSGTLIEVLEPGSATQIQDIIDNIIDASASKPYLIHLGPGVYDLGTTGIVMKEWVSIQGSGQEATKITGAVSTASNSATSAVLVGVNNTSLMDLSIENTGGSVISMGIYNNAASPRIERVSATASGGEVNYGVRNWESSPKMTNVTAVASGGMSSYGVHNDADSSPTLTNVTAIVSGGTGSNYGVHNDYDGSPTLTNVTAIASGGASSYGMFNTVNASPFIHDSMMEGGTKGLFINSASSSTRVVNSKIIGGVSDGPTGTINCRGNYDENLADVNC